MYTLWIRRNQSSVPYFRESNLKVLGDGIQLTEELYHCHTQVSVCVSYHSQLVCFPVLSLAAYCPTAATSCEREQTIASCGR